MHRKSRDRRGIIGNTRDGGRLYRFPVHNACLTARGYRAALGAYTMSVRRSAGMRLFLSWLARRLLSARRGRLKVPLIHDGNNTALYSRC